MHIQNAFKEQEDSIVISKLTVKVVYFARCVLFTGKINHHDYLL